MRGWVLICWALLALVGADECPDGGRCKQRQTCCRSPAGGFGCCPFDQAECCEDHVHCCPADTACNSATSSCVNATVSIPWAERASADRSSVSKSFQMIRTSVDEDSENTCPDQSRCPAEFSCLKASTKFGCCPVAKGVSCSDGHHCCPEGHRCSIDSRSCIQKEFETTVLCNDGVSECPQGMSCCETPEGKWGCCPMPKAVCCDDKEHCCAEGTTCDTKSMKCISTSTKKEFPMWAKFPARQRADWENLKGIEVPCNETAACPENATCCKNKKGDWGCCHLKEAVCCKDFKHCCPKGTKCNRAKRTCDDNLGSVPWVEKVSTIPRKDAELQVNIVPCNGTVGCPDGTTCCKTRQGDWGCCPFPEAVCCADFIHCCPKGRKCNLAAQTCDGGLLPLPLVKKVSAVPRKDVELQVNIVPCDGTTGCPDGTTCCKTQQGGWGCCPFPEAVCCEDFIHCCPNGKKCNLAAQTCDGGLLSVPLVKKVSSVPRKDVELQVNIVPCDSTTGCPDGTTCCKNQQGGWGCCPFPEAVCCEDFIHCCPNGKKCNLAAQTCDGGLLSVPLVKKVSSVPRKYVELQVNIVPCDGTTGCPDGTTCCKNQMGGWGCCPFPEAVCCEDFIHCCPNGKKCNLAAQTCDGGLLSVPLVKKVSSVPRKDVELQVNIVPCDGTTGCPDGTTCCKNQQGGWGCCPFPEAVCCEDFIHCCPNGKKCNLAAQTCDGGLLSVPLVKKVSSVPRKDVELQENIVPCDGTTGCPDGTTCCKNQQGGWGCCPFPEAVCCEDLIHCCPNGRICNLAAQTCDGGLLSLPLVKKVSSVPREDVELQVNIVPCDGTTGCPDGTTCCKTQQGGWGCCPFPEAVCCEDFIHCCPNGKKCNLAAQTCDGGLLSVPLVKKVSSVPRKDVELQVNIVPCDGTTGCPDGTTCCKNQQGGWGCCPFPEAVCCEDFIHCCPNGKKCNLAAQTCDGGLLSVPLVKKVSSVPRKDVELQENIVPCDGTTGCPDGTTCCKNQQGGWGCCPFPEAVCCEDFIHCCPNGKKCNLAAQTCDGGLLSVPLVKKVSSVPRKDVELQVNIVPCDGTTGCPDGTTCCKNQQGGWGCCPFPEAVCCEDFIHCCPNGKKCNLAAQTCDGGLLSVPLVKKVSSVPRKDVELQENIVPCDGTTGCPDGTTCCKNQQGDWGCCPFPEAVCCEDLIHCCPNGRICNLAAQTCDGGLLSLPLVKKVSSVPREDVELQVNIVPCDGTTGCPDGTTCCKTQQGGWGCCPFPEAVCCEDFIHCCPNGKKCNLAAQTCDGGLLSVPLVKKVSSVPRKDVELQVNIVPCDGTTGCPDGTTCCKNQQGGWGCCPFPEAVCCEDFIHCCPNGKKCNLAAQTCDGGLLSVPLVKKISSVPRQDVDPDVKVVPCEGSVVCPDGNTCCKTKADLWACCPLPQAVCCSDRMHCCPNGFACTEQGSCVQNPELNWSNWNWFYANKKRTQTL